ncbi:MAG: hypothetical protein KUG81_02605 [Gammaproteobacteria bacterium]|nr:hypothetical protein [Gammaproteobacteria bacterium]
MLPKDFPEWFSDFIDEQLEEVPTFKEQAPYNIDNLSIAYLRLWSIYETYIKILHKLYEKRCALKEIDAKIQQAENIAISANSWASNAKNISAAYLASIRFGEPINIDEKVVKFTAQIKTIPVRKYSVRKSDIALMPLPNGNDIDKASTEFGINGSEISLLLHPSNSDSRFYKTRNTIAHEGKSDIQLRNFIGKRINPLKEVVDTIKGYVNTT